MRRQTLPARSPICGFGALLLGLGAGWLLPWPARPRRPARPVRSCRQIPQDLQTAQRQTVEPRNAQTRDWSPRLRLGSTDSRYRPRMNPPRRALPGNCTVGWLGVMAGRSDARKCSKIDREPPRFRADGRRIPACGRPRVSCATPSNAPPFCARGWQGLKSEELTLKLEGLSATALFDTGRLAELNELPLLATSAYQRAPHGPGGPCCTGWPELSPDVAKRRMRLREQSITIAPDYQEAQVSLHLPVQPCFDGRAAGLEGPGDPPNCCHAARRPGPGMERGVATASGERSTALYRGTEARYELCAVPESIWPRRPSEPVILESGVRRQKVGTLALPDAGLKSIGACDPASGVARYTGLGPGHYEWSWARAVPGRPSTFCQASSRPRKSGGRS